MGTIFTRGNFSLVNYDGIGQYSLRGTVSMGEQSWEGPSA